MKDGRTEKFSETKRYPLFDFPCISPSPFSFESLFIGIFSLSLAGFLGIILGKMIYEPKNTLPRPQAAIGPLPTSFLISPTQKTQPFQQKALSAQFIKECPKIQWIDCTGERIAQEECTHEHLSRLIEACPNIRGAAY